MKKIFLFIFAFLFFIGGSLKAERRTDCGILTTYVIDGDNYIRIYFIPYVRDGESFKSGDLASYRAAPSLPGIKPSAFVCISYYDDDPADMVSIAPIPNRLSLNDVCTPDDNNYWTSKCVQAACEAVGTHERCVKAGYIPSNNNDQQQTPIQK